MKSEAIGEQEKVCTPNAECRQYCLALYRLTGEEVPSDDQQICVWPGRMDSLDEYASASDKPELVISVADSLKRVLDRREPVSGDDAERAKVASDTISALFAAHYDAWQYRADTLAAGHLVTDAEMTFFGNKVNAIQKSAGIEIEKNQVTSETLTLAQARHDRETLRNHGLIFDDSTVKTLDRLSDNVMYGHPTLLVGDKGSAKTQMAKFIARLYSQGFDPMVISGHGSMMSDELIGKIDLVQGKGTVFHEGKLIQCMREGRPVVIDEVNLTDQQIMMRLQDILLKRPGDTILLQENGNTPIVIKEGFSIIATANEASSRYQTREKLDPAFRDRFDVINIAYPDINTPHLTEYPSVNIRLALAHTINDDGSTNTNLNPNDAVTLARLAHATQRLYALPAKDVDRSVLDQSTSEIVDEDEPLLTDCITPRKMVTILQRMSTGTLVGSSFDREIERAITALDQVGTRNQTHARKLLELLTSSGE